MTSVTVVSDALCGDLISPADALAAMRELFIDLSDQAADNFPVVRERPGIADCVYGVKSGVNRARDLLGLKVGGYWPGNPQHDLARHQSTVLLTDPATGRPRALVGANLITALRTAASCALSIDLLARSDARTLAIIGAGGQALWHLQAAAPVRAFDKVLIWNRSPDAARALAARSPLPATVCASANALVGQADVVITITGATQPLFDADAVAPGAHLACMGSDTKGKQEAPSALLASARLFVDSVAQTLTLGECQHGAREEALTFLGDVAAGRAPGRIADDDITLFDGTGLGLQDLALAGLAVRLAAAQGRGAQVEL
jgi:ornithine cyclodeaminase